ncbi:MULTISPECIES: copper resistance CopC family protein [Thermomonosporaceae]|uniref:copper resistance CopC family protein n=1 Tax=Thermomonosporaceae TaxID=2012 RepID=UPI00255B0AA5|nr:MULTISPECIES: copper resistance protein CopC [Thermomonosporaceae]
MPLPPMRRLGVVAALVVAFGGALATPALAHTRLVSSTPGKDASAASVTEVELVFSDKISFAEVVVKDAAGKAFQQGKAEHEGPKVTQKLSAALPAGTYTVAYGVVGEDGHRIQKADLKFTATAGEGGGGGEEPTTGGVAAAEQTGAAATADEQPLKADQEPAKATDDSGSGMVTWIMIGGGVLIGIGIGGALVLRAKRRQRPAAGSGE